MHCFHNFENFRWMKIATQYTKINLPLIFRLSLRSFFRTKIQIIKIYILLQVTYNPDYLVPESDYFNNAVTCKMQYRGNWGRFSNCKAVHPFELL